MRYLDGPLPLTLLWNCVRCKIDCHDVSRDLDPGHCLDFCHNLADVGVLDPGHDRGRGHCHQESVVVFGHVHRNRAQNFGVFDVLCLFDLVSHDVYDEIDDGSKETETGFVVAPLPCSMAWSKVLAEFGASNS